MQGLFGQTVTEPLKGKQIPLFHEPNPAPAVVIPNTTPADVKIEKKFRRARTVAMFQEMDLRQKVKAELDRLNISYVEVEELCRKMSFTERRPFDFCVYAADGDNWLLLCGPYTGENVSLMTNWEQIFGDGFKPVFARDTGAGPRFIDLNRYALHLDSLK